MVTHLKLSSLAKQGLSNVGLPASLVPLSKEESSHKENLPPPPNAMKSFVP